jgi:hypothetical protein
MISMIIEGILVLLLITTVMQLITFEIKNKGEI